MLIHLSTCPYILPVVLASCQFIQWAGFCSMIKHQLFSPNFSIIFPSLLLYPAFVQSSHSSRSSQNTKRCLIEECPGARLLSIQVGNFAKSHLAVRSVLNHIYTLSGSRFGNAFGSRFVGTFFVLYFFCIHRDHCF